MVTNVEIRVPFYCYSQIQIGLDELLKNNELFNKIRPRVDGWENGK
jgi:hypothetical protein